MKYKKVMDLERHKIEFEEVRENCPWRFGDKCRPVIFSFAIIGASATLKDCIQKECALYHFRKYFEGRK